MKCKNHSSFDRTSTVGVCASCLREQLFILISTQSQYPHHYLHNESQSQPESYTSDQRRNSDPNHHHTLTFPRSVSPFVTGEKFNDDFGFDFPDRKFHSTPQIGCAASEKKMTKKKNKFSFIKNLFKYISNKSESNPRTPSTSSPLWCPAGRKPKPVPKFVNDRLQTQNQNRTRTRSKVSDRGMSPEWEEEEDTSSMSSESCEPRWKQTPVSTSSGGQPMRRRHSNMSGLAFCLSPLVRASPNRNWNWNRNRNSFPIESGDSGVRKTGRLADKNRSKKMADFGRSGGGGFDHRR